MTDTKRLLPCPFCGSYNLSFHEPTAFGSPPVYLAQIHCCNCGAEMPAEGKDENKIIRKWNMRDGIVQKDMPNNDKRRFIVIEKCYITKVLDLIKFYGECSDTDCKACELGDVCRKAVELEDGIKELEEKWEENK